MSTHTSAPWVFVRKHQNNSGTIVGPDKGSVCAIASSVRRYSDEKAANAALISAAPDLLDALQRVLRHIPADAGGASMSDDIWRAQMAIKKALGKA